MRKILLALAILLAACLWAIGPDGRRLLLNFPTNTDVLFWSQKQRNAGFRMLDRVPFLVAARPISTGGAPAKALPNGAPLDLNLDLDAYMQAQQHASVIVLHKGAIRLEKYGLEFGPDGRWTSFSVAKSLTSTLVGAAIKDGFIDSLEDPVSKYIKGLKGSAYDDVTIAQLLTMSSGVRWNEDYEDPNSDVARFNNHKAKDGSSNLVSYMNALPRAHPAGEVWNYSTGETNLIGVLVREATKKPLADYLSEKIWSRLGVRQQATWLLNEDGTEISGCCIQATTRDFARFGQFILDGAKIDGESILPEGWIAQATTKRIGIGAPGFGYGFQWWTYDSGAFAARGIFGQGIYIDPARDLVIATNGNWRSALGERDGENAAREAFFQRVANAIDTQN